MASYRFYMLDQIGQTLTASDADCGSDERAFAWAQTTLGEDAGVEIWQGDRRVGRVLSASRMVLRSAQAILPTLNPADWPSVLAFVQTRQQENRASPRF